MIQQDFHNAPKTDAISPLGVVDKPSVVGVLYSTIMKEIKLTQGYVALVDDEDHEELSKFKWNASKDKNTVYAIRQRRKSENFGKLGILMHRQILGLVDTYGQVDHKDRNGLNNQKSNLRTCTNMENQWNSKRKTGKNSNYIGVRLNKTNTWDAYIRINGKRTNLGTFKTEIEAAIAYDNAVIKLRGEFGRTNILTQ